MSFANGYSPYTVNYNQNAVQMQAISLNGEDLELSFSDPGDYNVVFVDVTDNNGCTNTNIQPSVWDVYVADYPSVSLLSLGDTICSGDVFSDLILSDLNVDYHWTTEIDYGILGVSPTSGSGSIIGVPFTNTTSMPLSVDYLITPATANCIGTTVNYTVVVNPLPQIVLAETQNISLDEIIELFEFHGYQPWELTYYDGNDTIILNTTDDIVYFSNNISGDYPYNIISYKDNLCYYHAIDNYSFIITVDSIMLPWDDYVISKWNNTFLLDLNQLNFNDIEFVTCTWYENGNILGQGNTYSKGNNIDDVFIDGAVYHFELTQSSGQIIRSTDKIYTTENHDIQIYPNPVTMNTPITIDLGSDSGDYENENIEIYNILGEKLIEKSVEGEKSVINMNFAPGVYMVKVRNNNYQIVVE